MGVRFGWPRWSFQRTTSTNPMPRKLLVQPSAHFIAEVRWCPVLLEECRELPILFQNWHEDVSFQHGKIIIRVGVSLNAKGANNSFTLYPAQNYDFRSTLNIGVRHPMWICITPVPHILPVPFTSNIKICLLWKRMELTKSGTFWFLFSAHSHNSPCNQDRPLSIAATFSSSMGATC